MQKVQRSDNIQSIQFLRGIAALLVLLCHSVAGPFFRPEQTLYKICAPGWMGVEIFFIISGFIIPYSMYINDYELRDFKNFFAKRLVRIEPPYIVSIIMILLLNYSNTLTPWYHGPAYKIDWANVLGHLGYLNAYTFKPWLNWAYWTLAIEFQYYFILTLVYPLLTHKNKKVLLVVFFALLACTFIHIPGYGDTTWKPFKTMIMQDSASQIMPFLPFFLMGIALFLLRVKKITTAEFWPMMVITFFVCFYRNGVVLLGVSAFTLACIHYIKKVPGYLMLLGTISYSLYLTHGVLIPRFMALNERYTKLNQYAAWFLSLVGCMVFAYFYYRAIEKPFVRISKKIKFKHPRKTDAQSAVVIPD